MGSEIFNILHIILHALSYIVIIISFYFSYRKIVSIPFIACNMNIALEANLIIHNFHAGYIVLLTLDIIILIINSYVYFKRNIKFGILYIIFLIIFTLLMYFVFKQFDISVLSIFIVELVISIDFLICFKYLNKKYRFLICLFRLLGDLSLGIYYLTFNQYILFLVLLTLTFNVIYLVFCIMESNDIKKQNDKVKKVNMNNKPQS